MAAVLREQYARGVLAHGYHRLDTRSERYWVFHKPGAATVPYIFLGKAGAVRGGRSKRADLSFPLSADSKAELLKRGELPAPTVG